MAAEEGNIVRGIFTGEEQPEDHWEDEDGDVWPIILLNVTHLSVHNSMTVIRRDAFYGHLNLVELICHAGLKKIEESAFQGCRSLKRLIMPGVEAVEARAFLYCDSLAHLECENLETIGQFAFYECRSLSSIDLPSAKSVEKLAFHNCKSLRDVKFGEHLESLGYSAFSGCISLRDVKFGEHLESLGDSAFADCISLEQITIPLKSDLDGNDCVFQGCDNLKRVCLVEDNTLHETTDALLLAEWRQDMSDVIDSISQSLPNRGITNPWGKTRAIREWIELVKFKIRRYKAKHCCLLRETAAILQLHLLDDIVHNNVLAFLELP